MITREDITYKFHEVEPYPYVNVTLEIQWKNFLDPLQMEKLRSKNPLRKLEQEIERLASQGKSAILEKIYGDIRTDILDLKYLVLGNLQLDTDVSDIDSKFNAILRKLLGSNKSSVIGKDLEDE